MVYFYYICNMDLYIDEKTRKSLGREVGLSILQRGDMLARDMLEQLRKSTDRAYTMLGLLLTAFSAVTGFMFAVGLSPVIVPLFVLWTGLVISLYILFTKAVWVNKFCPRGNDPVHLLSTVLPTIFTACFCGSFALCALLCYRLTSS